MTPHPKMTTTTTELSVYGITNGRRISSFTIWSQNADQIATRTNRHMFYCSSAVCGVAGRHRNMKRECHIPDTVERQHGRARFVRYPFAKCPESKAKAVLRCGTMLSKVSTHAKVKATLLFVRTAIGHRLQSEALRHLKLATLLCNIGPTCCNRFPRDDRVVVLTKRKNSTTFIILIF
jgi:hypothetical protein